MSTCLHTTLPRSSLELCTKRQYNRMNLGARISSCDNSFVHESCGKWKIPSLYQTDIANVKKIVEIFWIEEKQQELGTACL